MLKYLGLILLLCLSAISVHAAEPAQSSDPNLQEAEAATNELTGKKTWEAGLQRLLAIEDDRVRFILQHLADRKVMSWQDRPVFVPVAPSAEAPAPIYSIFTDPKAPGEALATVEAVDRFRAQRKSRKPTLSALTVIGLRAKDPEVRKEAAFDLGNRQVPSSVSRTAKAQQRRPRPSGTKSSSCCRR